MMNVLVLNTGSSSVKFQIIATDLSEIEHNADERLARGLIERVGGEAVISLQAGDGPARKSTASLVALRAAIDHILRWVISPDSGVAKINSLSDIHAVGHRVVHGGEQFQRSAVIDEAVMEGIEACIDLAPLHNPNNLKGIRAVQSLLGRDVPQVAVFDTAFHHTLPERSYLYAIPYQYYRRHKIRRYGFHGTSHRYVAYRYRLLRKIEREHTNIITIHLGNGCSAAAIRGGESIDTSMGMTPLEGLVMGTRSGDIDPAVIDFVASKEGMSAHQVENMLNKQSGLLGLSGLTHDMRELVDEFKEHSDRRAGLAIEVFCYRVRKYIGSFLAGMEGADALVFTGGIGENSPEIRSRICDGLSWMGLTLDQTANEKCIRGAEGPIHAADSRLAAYVVPTNEELLIARDTVRCIRGVPCP